VACGEAALPAFSSLPIFSVSAFQNLSFSAFTSRLPLSFQNDSSEGNHSSLGKFSIFIQGSSPRFPASGRSTRFLEIGSLHSVKICTMTLFSNHNILMRAMTPGRLAGSAARQAGIRFSLFG